MRQRLHPGAGSYAALAIAGLTFVALVGWLMYDAAPTRLDYAAHDLVADLDPSGTYQWGDTWLEEGIDFAFFGLLDLLVVYVAWRVQGVLLAALVATSIILQEFLILVLQAGLARARPDGAFETHGAFPSGHVANLVLPLLLVLLIILPLTTSKANLGRSLLGPTLGFLVAYALFRLASAEHWATDILGAFALGVAWALISALLIRPWVAPTTLGSKAALADAAALGRR